MTTLDTRRQALVDVAAAWRDPDHPPRVEAVEATLEAPNRWTEEALTYALNLWMQRVTEEALDRWVGAGASNSMVVGVLPGSSDPMEGFRDVMAAWATGHRVLGTVPDASPALIPAFFAEVSKRCPEETPEFLESTDLFARADAIMAQPEPETVDSLHENCDVHEIPSSRRLVRPPLLTIGLLDGNESEGERDRLAEDLLLYEGGGHRRLALMWAPRDLSPDLYLEAMAQFRGAFPVHPDTPGALEMQQAFLDAQDEPHAYAEGLQFLVSRGAPEPQPPGHIRWSEYDEREEVETWVQNHPDELYAVVAREALHDRLPDAWSLRTPGGLHVPPLDDKEGVAIATFVQSLE